MLSETYSRNGVLMCRFTELSNGFICILGNIARVDQELILIHFKFLRIKHLRINTPFRCSVFEAVFDHL
jgi:hypothetical protein